MPEFTAIKGRFISVAGVKLYTVESGAQDGPLALLLHGFPEFSSGFRKQLGPLANGGLRILAPDQRGYAMSDKPEGIDAYRLDHLASDVIGLIDALGYEKASLVGHDWGGIVAWAAAALHPERIEKLAVLNAPHPSIALRSSLLHPWQFIKSAYILFFNLPRLPEKTLSRNNWKLLADAMLKSSRPGTFTQEDLKQYRWAWEQKGAITAMLNWYRALIRLPVELPTDKIAAPTLILWGAKDSALGRYLANASLKQCQTGQLKFFENATHWVQHEEAERVNQLLLDFLKS